MNKLIIGAAMKEELEPILKISNIKKQYSIANIDIYEVVLFDKDVVLYKTNISRTNAAAATSIVLEKYKSYKCIVINVGSSGAGKSRQNILDTVISDKLNYSENTVDGYDKGQVPHMPSVYITDRKLLKSFADIIKDKEKFEIGNFVCSESFLSSEKVHDEAIKTNILDIASIDMESTAVAQVCYSFSIPFIGIRTISDNIKNHKVQNTNDQFSENINQVYTGYLSILEIFIRDYYVHN